MSSIGDDFVNAIHREIERYTAGRHNKRVGLVTSWDPNKHLAKVMFQPEGHETGWLPVHTMAAGDGYGHMTGLTAGDGITTGDQVEVIYQEGDFETGAIVARIHSEVDPAPTVQSGEQLFQTPFGQFIKLSQDGSATIQHKDGNYAKVDSLGNIVAHLQNTSNQQQVYLGGDPNAPSGNGMTFAPVSTTSGPSPFVQARLT